MTFFPSDFEVINAQAPLCILSEAKNEWDAKGKGVVTLLIDEGSPASLVDDDTDMTFIHVYLTHIPTGRVENLLTVIHANGKPYPARINPEKEDTPHYLRKQRIVPAKKPGLISASILQSLSEAIPAHTVTEEWVCESPDDFRKQLAKALTLGRVKSAITNIIAVSRGGSVSDDNSELSVDEAELDGIEDDSNLD